MTMKLKEDGETTSIRLSGPLVEISPTQRKDFELCPRIFVYGTLKRNEGRHSVLQESEFIAETNTVSNFVLGNVGFPFAFPSDVVPSNYKSLLHPVKGEVYTMDKAETLYVLDMVESYPVFYNRKIVNLANGVSSWMYVQEDWEYAFRCEACNLKEGVWVW